MKTAVSIPDEVNARTLSLGYCRADRGVFEKVERIARRSRKSRSEVFSAALREYVARHAPDEVTEAMNRVCSELGEERGEFVSVAGRHILENVEC